MRFFSLLLISLIILSVTTKTYSQSKEKPNPGAPPETNQYQFVIGKWELDISYKDKNGNWNEYKGEWICTWMVNGYLLHQDWKGPFIRGSEFKAFDSQKQKWVGKYFYEGRPWATSEGEWKEGQIITLKNNSNTSAKNSINRETYYDIKGDSFKVKSEISLDDGKTWQEGFYKIKAQRK